MSSKPKNKLLTLHQLVPYLFYSRDYICQKLLLSDIDFQHLCSRHGIISWPSEMLDELQHSIIHNMHRIPPEELDTLVENKITTCLNECILTSHISQEMIMSVFRQLSHRIHVQYAQQQNQKQQRQQQQKQQESSSSSLSSTSLSHPSTIPSSSHSAGSETQHHDYLKKVSISSLIDVETPSESQRSSDVYHRLSFPSFTAQYEQIKEEKNVQKE
eukprot:gb/GECH01003668.1/.p1 GENE.gb/GECH01003668.1/~~gb/GECH01003668.1/.p1  ORF type:complete len:215 (+),score=59.63 gb/GECH01003668.1/:1-645(+)